MHEIPRAHGVFLSNSCAIVCIHHIALLSAGRCLLNFLRLGTHLMSLYVS